MNDKCIVCGKGFVECIEDDPFPEDHFHTFDASDVNLPLIMSEKDREMIKELLNEQKASLDL